MKKITTNNFVLKIFESILVIGYILFEELVWNVFAKPIFQYFKRLAILDSLKTTFLVMNRYLLLTVFIIILLVTEVMGFLAAYCFVEGLIFTGIIVYASKIPVAAFTFWLFDLSKDKLLTFHWLKTAYDYIIGLIEKFVNSPIHVYIKTQITAIRTRMKSLVIQYFGEEGFRASVKTHYAVIKPYFANILKRG